MRPADVPFRAHIDLLQAFLAHRTDIVEAVQALLNAQRKPVDYLRDRSLLFRQFEGSFFAGAAVTSSQSRLQGQLERAHWADGFEPRPIAGLYNGLIDPAELMMRAFHLWRETRWPGRSGRVHFAHALFNVYVLRCLVLLSLRVWDDDSHSASDGLSDIQRVLDGLWTGSPTGQPALVRDARWLIPLAQSPATDDLGAYFRIAENVAAACSEDDRIEIHKAGVRMAGGHLRSQLRYHATKQGVSLDENGLILSARSSNALDFALLVQDLVPLLDAYERAANSGDRPERLELADAICQGISPDPELFLNRVELLGAYSMIQHLFVTTDESGQVVHTAIGRRHVHLLEKYCERIGRVSKALLDDCSRFRPIRGTYSPFGVLYGFTVNLIEHMAFRTLQPGADTRFSLEDVFSGGMDDQGKLAWVTGWRTLPHLSPAVQAVFDYPQQFAEGVFARLQHALSRRVADDERTVVSRTGRLFVLPDDTHQAVSVTSAVADLPVEYVQSSDMQFVAAHKAAACDEAKLVNDEREGKFVIAYPTPHGRVAMSKALLSDVLGAGRDVKIAGIPPAAADAMALMYPGLVVVERGQR